MIHPPSLNQDCINFPLVKSNNCCTKLNNGGTSMHSVPWSNNQLKNFEFGWLQRMGKSFFFIGFMSWRKADTSALPVSAGLLDLQSDQIIAPQIANAWDFLPKLYENYAQKKQNTKMWICIPENLTFDRVSELVCCVYVHEQRSDQLLLRGCLILLNHSSYPLMK